MSTSAEHKPVLLDETINSLQLKDNELYVDATFGLGGYTKAILNRKNCSVLAIDRDPEAKKFANDIKSNFNDRFIFKNRKFSELLKILNEVNINKVAGIVFDLGVSSPQLNKRERGFSFMYDGPLDMRMSLRGPTAEEFINKVSLMKDHSKELKAPMILPL